MKVSPYSRGSTAVMPSDLTVGRMVEINGNHPDRHEVGHVVKFEGAHAVVRLPHGDRLVHWRSLVALPTQAEIAAQCAGFRRAAGLPEVADEE